MERVGWLKDKIDAVFYHSSVIRSRSEVEKLKTELAKLKRQK